MKFKPQDYNKLEKEFIGFCCFNYGSDYGVALFEYNQTENQFNKTQINKGLEYLKEFENRDFWTTLNILKELSV